MNITKNPKKFFLNLILSFIFIIFITVQLLTWSLYFNFEQNGIQIVYQLEKRNLITTADNIGNVFDSTETLCKQIFVDSGVKNLMSGLSMQTYEANQIIDRLVSYSNSASYVHSIYIYSKKQDYIYCTLSSLSENTEIFFDREIVDIIQNLEVTELKPVPRIIKRQYPNSKIASTTNVYTFILYDYGSERKSADSAVIVNINADSITSKLKTLAFDNNSIYMLLDRSGVVMGSSQKGLFS